MSMGPVVFCRLLHTLFLLCLSTPTSVLVFRLSSLQHPEILFCFKLSQQAINSIWLKRHSLTVLARFLAHLSSLLISSRSQLRPHGLIRAMPKRGLNRAADRHGGNLNRASRGHIRFHPVCHWVMNETISFRFTLDLKSGRYCAALSPKRPGCAQAQGVLAQGDIHVHAASLHGELCTCVHRKDEWAVGISL
jgi:hypothetical protein